MTTVYKVTRLNEIYNLTSISIDITKEPIMEKTWKPTTAGILTIIAGASGIGGGTFIVLYGGLLGLGGALAETLGERMSAFIAILAGMIGAFGISMIGIGIVAVICGIFTLRRKFWGLALAGTILATICSTLLGILAIIFVSMSKKEFS